MNLVGLMTCGLMASLFIICTPEVIASPVAQASSDVIEHRSWEEHSKALEVRQLPELPEGCKWIGRKIRNMNAEAMVIAFLTVGGDLTEAICHISQGVGCEYWAKAVRISIYLIYVGFVGTESAIPAPGPAPGTGGGGGSEGGTSDYHIAALEWWQTSLTDIGLSFDAIDVLPFNTSTAALRSRDGDPKLLSRVRFTGVMDAKTGSKHDIIINQFEGNKAVLHLPYLTPSGDTTHGYDSPGFKISFTTRQPSALSRTAKDDMAGTLADTWFQYTRVYYMDELIGLAKSGHEANFYFRITPEPKAFGLEYESVDICGGMSHLL